MIMDTASAKREVFWGVRGRSRRRLRGMFGDDNEGVSAGGEGAGGGAVYYEPPPTYTAGDTGGTTSSASGGWLDTVAGLFTKGLDVAGKVITLVGPKPGPTIVKPAGGPSLGALPWIAAAGATVVIGGVVYALAKRS